MTRASVRRRIGGGSPENALTGTIFQVDDVGANRRNQDSL